MLQSDDKSISSIDLLIVKIGVGHGFIIHSSKLIFMLNAHFFSDSLILKKLLSQQNHGIRAHFHEANNLFH